MTMHRQVSRLVFVVLNLLCGSSALVPGPVDAAPPLRASPGTWVTLEEQALLRRSYLRCVAQGYSRAGYGQSRSALDLAYQHHLDDLTATVTSREIADAPKELERRTSHISCQWFKPSPR
ncbi:MAG: hypothetical protein JWP43_2658 [Ramlibacter sp.]|jgi:hypothetical protein|nr:hypothetical protein [Ramlibacter sp.]